MYKLENKCVTWGEMCELEKKCVNWGKKMFNLGKYV